MIKSMQNRLFYVRLWSREQADAAFSFAQQQGCSLALLSPPDVIRTHGAHWFIALCSNAAAAQPNIPYQVIFDCDASAGYALAALDAGADAIALAADLPPPLVQRLSDIATRMGRQIAAIPETGLADGADLLKSPPLIAPPTAPQESSS